MLDKGIPPGAVKQRMACEGVNPDALDLDRSKPVPLNLPAQAVPPPRVPPRTRGPEVLWRKVAPEVGDMVVEPPKVGGGGTSTSGPDAPRARTLSHTHAVGSLIGRKAGVNLLRWPVALLCLLR